MKSRCTALPLRRALVESLECRQLLAAADYFAILCKDAATNRGVPQVDLMMTDGTRFTSDNNGYIAFNRSGYMNVADTFIIESYGYAKSGGGNSISFTPTLGGSGTVTLARSQIAENLYRATGQNKLDESQKLGMSTTTNDPIDNSGHISGQDTEASVVYKGKLYQFWQDTGIDADNNGSDDNAVYRSTGAVSDLQANGGLSPDVGQNKAYFATNGSARAMFPSSKFGGSGLYWLDTPMVVPDAGGNEKLVAGYTIVNGTGGHGETRGFAVFNDTSGDFDYVSGYSSSYGVALGGSATGRLTVGTDQYIIISQSIGLMRVKATYADVTNINNYQTYTPLKSGTIFTGPDFFGNTSITANDLQKDGNGNIVWGWRSNVRTLGNNALNALISAGLMTRASNPFNFTNVNVAGDYKAFNFTSFTYNNYLHAWTMIGQGQYDNDVWYAESNSLTGPWDLTKSVATHHRQDRDYTFYNVQQHPEFNKDGQYLYFEGTYTLGYADGGLIADYFNTNNLAGYESEKFIGNVDSNFGTGAPANTNLPADNFSIRYTGKLIMPSQSGSYTFRVTADDGFRLYVNNNTTPILDQWNGAAGAYTVNLSASAGSTLSFKLEYRELTGSASVKLELANPSTPTTFTTVPSFNGTYGFKHDAPVNDDNYNQFVYRMDLSDPSLRSLNAGTGLTAQFFDNVDFTSYKKTFSNQIINSNWGAGSPDPTIDPDTFSARYTGTIQTKYSEAYTFYATADDGVRVWINGVNIINHWANQSGTFTSTPITLQAGKRYDIRVDYYENTGNAQLSLEWQSATQARQIVPASALYASQNGLTAQLFNNKDLTASVGFKDLSLVNQNLPNGNPGSSDSSYLQNDGTYSVRYSGQVRPDFSGLYTFATNSDDGVRVWVNGVQLIDNWTNHSTTHNTGSITLEAGKLYDIVMEYYNDGFAAVSQLYWSNTSQTGGVESLITTENLFANVPTSAALPAAFFAGSATATGTSRLDHSVIG